jgi:hypothetical protein
MILLILVKSINHEAPHIFPPPMSSHLHPGISFSTLFLNTLNLCFSLDVPDQFLHS